MEYQTFHAEVQPSYPIAFLVPKLEADGMVREYIEPATLDRKEVIAYKLYQAPGKKKTSASDQREFLTDLLPVLKDLDTKYLVVSDGEYFKTLTGTKKADAYLGYVLPNRFPEDLANEFSVIYCPNYRQVFYDPGRTRARIKQAFDALWSHQTGSYREPGCSIISFSAYPESVTDIRGWLKKLHQYDALSCDIETFSLKHYSAGIGTVTFCWNQHEGIAFAVDLGSDPPAIRKALLKFFLQYKGRLIWHNASFDVGVLIYQLFMADICDRAGLLDGLECFYENREWDDTKLLAYLATNSTSGNELGLKKQAQEFAGNYAVEEIEDITSIPLPRLLEYNLVDGLSTWYVYNKHRQTVIDDEQEEIYQTLFKPALLDITDMQLTGMPIYRKQVLRVEKVLGEVRSDALHRIQSAYLVRELVSQINDELEEERYSDWEERKANGVKVRPYTSGNFDEEFNPNSPKQMQRLFYEVMGLPIIERTDTKQPATGAEVLEKLKAYTEDPDERALIDAVLEFKAVDKICGTFIPAMKNAQKGPDRWYYLFGNFNLGGTVSGRLSSSDPNLQNLPSNVSMRLSEALLELHRAFLEPYLDKKGKLLLGKLVKSCFRAPPGWLFIGLDFASLEDRISALTTKDPNKLKVYSDGFDGHSLRAYSYFGEQMPDIDPGSVESINSIASRYPDLRQDSKMPTFALTYQGTYLTLMAKGDFSKEMAQQIEARYHELYKVSDEWVARKLDEASKKGYITVAFGLRVRTPLLHQVVRGNSRTPHEAEAEGRTAGNAMGQSYCMLNSRAGVEFNAKARKSKYRLDIRPCSQIHDAQYHTIPDDIAVLMYVNEHLVQAVEWQDHPDIAHDIVKLGGTLSVFHPSWAKEIEIPNGATSEEIFRIVAAKTE